MEEDWRFRTLEPALDPNLFTRPSARGAGVHPSYFCLVMVMINHVCQIDCFNLK